MSKQQFVAGVRKAKAYIRAGDIFQVVPSQRFSADISADPFEIYRALRVVNPSPYLCFLRLDDVSVVCSSPEMLVKVQGRDAFYSPIAGTEPRGRDEEKTARLKRSFAPIRKSVPSTSCWSIWDVMTWAACASTEA